MRVEGGLCLVMVGGKEGIYPRAEDGAVLKFAREVRPGFSNSPSELDVLLLVVLNRVKGPIPL